MIPKPIIHMIQEGTKLPFDVNPQRTIFYARTKPAQIKRAREELSAHVTAVLAPEFVLDNPVTAARGRLQFEESATPKDRVILNELESIKDRLSAIEDRGTSSPENTRSLTALDTNSPFEKLLALKAQLEGQGAH